MCIFRKNIFKDKDYTKYKFPVSPFSTISLGNGLNFNQSLSLLDFIMTLLLHSKKNPPHV